MSVAAAFAALAAAAAPGWFFDDFSQPDLQVLQTTGWTVRSEAGHPGVPGAAWGPGTVRLVDDPAAPGNRLVQLVARTDGTPAGTAQAQLCQQRRFFRGTYAARVRFADRPLQGADGDAVIQSFYALAPLRFALDPEFSEVDFEYLPNGGWGSAKTRLYAISWQTVQIEPWLAYNQAHEEFRSFDGWHVLMIHVTADHTEHFVDGRALARHGGRNVPVSPMAINFNLWFAPAALLPPGALPRVYAQEVDWVMHVSDRLLAPAAVQAQVAAWRHAGRAHVDTIAAPPLAGRCNL
jgi:hypothetical protein